MKEHNEEMTVDSGSLEQDAVHGTTPRSDEIYTAEERVPVARDEKSVADDADGYKFLKPTKKRHSNMEAESSPDLQSDDLSEELVFSAKESSDGTHHHHHHHSDGSSDGTHHHHHHHHHHRHRRRRMKKWKKVLLIVVSSLLALVIALGGVFLILRNLGRNELFDSDLNIVVPEKVAEVQDDGDYIVYDGHTYRYNTDITSMLFLGIDKRSMDDENEMGTGGQADVAVVIALNMKDHKISMIAVPRDTITEVAMFTPSGHYNGMKDMQVCLAYAYGDGKETSCENMVSSVRKIFYNIPIKTYFALDLDGIAAVNDSVGGVDVVSPETIEYFIEGEQYHLMGKDAENFVRLRDKSSIDSSLKRLERQKVYARGFMAKMMSSIKKDVTSAVRVFNESAPYSCTNMTAAKVSYLASEVALGGSMATDMMTVPGTMSYENELARYDIAEKEFFEQFLSVYYERVS